MENPTGYNSPILASKTRIELFKSFIIVVNERRLTPKKNFLPLTIMKESYDEIPQDDEHTLPSMIYFR